MTPAILNALQLAADALTPPRNAEEAEALEAIQAVLRNPNHG